MSYEAYAKDQAGRVLRKFMAEAYNVAENSPDPSSQNGAVLVRCLGVGEYQFLCAGYNHFYDGIVPELNDRTEKLKRIEHAERDCLYNAASSGFTTKGCVLVTPWAACWDCARAIIGCDISAVVFHRQRYAETDIRWKNEVDEAIQAIRASGIFVYGLDGPIPDTRPIRISGRYWNPESCEYVNEPATA